MIAKYKHPNSSITLVRVGWTLTMRTCPDFPYRCRNVHQGCPIYGKIRFLRICIACFSLRKKIIDGRIYGFCLTRFGYNPPPPPLPFRDRGILGGKTIFGQIYGFFRTEFDCYPPPPPPDFRLAVFRARRVNLFGCAEWTFGYYMVPEISGFFGIPIGQPWL